MLKEITNVARSTYTTSLKQIENISGYKSRDLLIRIGIIQIIRIRTQLINSDPDPQHQCESIRKVDTVNLAPDPTFHSNPHPTTCLIFLTDFISALIK